MGIRKTSGLCEANRFAILLRTPEMQGFSAELKNNSELNINAHMQLSTSARGMAFVRCTRVPVASQRIFLFLTSRPASSRSREVKKIAWALGPTPSRFGVFLPFRRCLVAHEIDQTTGRAAVFVTGEPAWHRLGTVIEQATTSAEAIGLAGIGLARRTMAGPGFRPGQQQS